jgi:UDP:flavonoid glycosyltransferase YjiC (YdhE family)
LQPWIVPSVYEPPVMPVALSLPRWAPRPVGRLYWWLFHTLGDLFVCRELNRLRCGLGLRPVRRLFHWWHSPDLSLGLFPDWYALPQPDWPPQMRLAGFPMFDGHDADRLPPHVLDFCRVGDPPVVFTFGTGMMHADVLFRAALDACQKLGVRALFLTRYRHQLPETLPDTVLHCEFAPFQKLFPLCAAVAHHGGIGTTAKALATGTPQLIFPFAFDQRDNATRVKRLGAGEWLKPRRRTGADIAAALARLMTAEVRESCRAAAVHFGDDNGLENAASMLEELAERAGRRHLIATRNGTA